MLQPAATPVESCDNFDKTNIELLVVVSDQHISNGTSKDNVHKQLTGIDGDHRQQLLQMKLWLFCFCWTTSSNNSHASWVKYLRMMWISTFSSKTASGIFSGLASTLSSSIKNVFEFFIAAFIISLSTNHLNIAKVTDITMICKTWWLLWIPFSLIDVCSLIKGWSGVLVSFFFLFFLAESPLTVTSWPFGRPRFQMIGGILISVMYNKTSIYNKTIVKITGIKIWQLPGKKVSLKLY